MFFRRLRRTSKALVIIVVVAFALGGSLYGISMFFGDSGYQQQWGELPGTALAPDEPLLTVNGVDVPYREFYNLIQGYMSVLYYLPPEDIMMFQNQVVNFLIEREIMLQEAKKRELTVSISDEQVQKIIDDYLENAEMTKQQFLDQLRQTGDTIAAVESRVRDGLWEQEILIALEEDVKSEVIVSDEEIRAGMQQVRVQTIDVLFEDYGREGAMDEITDAWIALLEGEDFQDIAARYNSEAQVTPELIRRTDDLASALLHYAFAVQEGEISDVYTTDDGYHILKVIERIPASDQEFAENRDRIEELIREEQASIYFDEWFQNKKDGTLIQIHEPVLAGYYWYVKGDLEQALTNLDTAIKEDPDFAFIYEFKANTLLRMGETQKAKETFQEAVARFTGDWDLRLAYTEFLYNQGEEEEAKEQLRSIVETENDNQYLMEEILPLLKALGMDEEVEIAQEALQGQNEMDMGPITEEIEEEGNE